MNLPSNIKCENTSGMQGVNDNGDYYYVTVINHNNLGVYMHKSNDNILFPSWTVSNIKIGSTVNG